MNAFQCLRLAARSPTTTTTRFRPTLSHSPLAQRTRTPTPIRHFSHFPPRRPLLPRGPTSLPVPGSLAAQPTAACALDLDLVGKISAHPGLASLQIRCGPRDTYNPSHVVRKRRHGFLSRIRTRKGRKMIMKRLKKGRWNLSH